MVKIKSFVKYTERDFKTLKQFHEISKYLTVKHFIAYLYTVRWTMYK